MQTVLVVDDSTLMRQIVSRAVKAVREVEVRHASDGQDALEVFDADDIDLLITDLNMPRMSGEELLTALSERGSLPPTVVISSTISSVRRLQLLRLGVEHVIPKPFRPPELLVQLRAFMHSLAPLSDIPTDLRVKLDAAMMAALSNLAGHRASALADAPVPAGLLLMADLQLRGPARGSIALVASQSWCEETSEELMGSPEPEDFIGELANIAFGGLVSALENELGTRIELSPPDVTTLARPPVEVSRVYHLDDESRVGVLWRLRAPAPQEVPA